MNKRSFIKLLSLLPFIGNWFKPKGVKPNMSYCLTESFLVIGKAPPNRLSIPIIYRRPRDE